MSLFVFVSVCLCVFRCHPTRGMAPPRSSRPTRPSQNRRGSSSARSRDSASLRRSDARSSPLSSSSSSAAALRSDDVDSATTSSRPHPQHDAGVSSGRVNRSSSSRRSGEAAGLSMRGDEMDEESRAAAEIARVAQLRGHRVSGLSRLAALQDEDEDEEEDDDALEERGRRHPHRHGGSDGEGDGEEEDEEADGTGPDTEDDDQGEDLMENLVAYVSLCLFSFFSFLLSPPFFSVCLFLWYLRGIYICRLDRWERPKCVCECAYMSIENGCMLRLFSLLL